MKPFGASSKEVFLLALTERAGDDCVGPCSVRPAAVTVRSQSLSLAPAEEANQETSQGPSWNDPVTPSHITSLETFTGQTGFFIQPVMCNFQDTSSGLFLEVPD